MQDGEGLSRQSTSQHEAQSGYQHGNREQILKARFRWLILLLIRICPLTLRQPFSRCADKSKLVLVGALVELCLQHYTHNCSIADASIDLRVFTLPSDLLPASLE